MEADEAAQHVRRIIWRFGNGEAEPIIFVTTRVNFLSNSFLKFE
jgi:hypothetical protein